MHSETSRSGECRPVQPAAARLDRGRMLRRRAAAMAGVIGMALVTAWSAETARAQESQPQRTEILEQMSDAEKSAVLQKRNRFDALSPAEQARRRQIHNELSQDPQQAELLRVLERYYDWLRTLTPMERAEVLSLPVDQRLEKIKDLTRMQEAKRQRMMAGGFMMSSRDLTVIHDWFDKFLDAHTAEILATLPDEPPFDKLKKDYDPERDRHVLRFHYIFSTDPKRPRPSQEDEAHLQTLVSQEAQKVLADADEHQRSRMILFWIGAAVLHRMRTNPSLEELDEFAQDKKLVSDQEREWLESLPRDRMYRELRVLYKQRRFAADPSRRFPWDRGPGGGRKPGPEGGPGFDGPPPPGFPGGPFGKPDGPPGPPPTDPGK